MPKLAHIDKKENGFEQLFWWCPGCKERHRAEIRNGHHNTGKPSWEFNGNEESPTLSPSVNYVGYCHFWVRAGTIEFCADCRHALAGKTVPMVPCDADGYALEP